MLAESAIPFLSVSGTPAERGASIGTAFRQRIALATEFYARLFKLQEKDLSEQGNRFAKNIRMFSPDMAAEVEACAEASGIPAYRIFAMNARSEILSSTGVPECTAVAFTSTSVLGQTWDWVDAFEDLFVVVRQQLTEGRCFLTVTEPGMLAKIGLNSAGIGVCLNFLGSDRPWQSGVPVHVFLRALLECPDWGAAHSLINDHATGVIGNVLTMSAVAAQTINIEGDVNSAYITQPSETVFAHTNHYLRVGHSADQMAILGNSHGRLEAALQMSFEADSLNVEALMRILSDQARGPISCPYTDFAGIRVGTVCAVAMDLKTGTLHIRKGPDPEAQFESYSVSP